VTALVSSGMCSLVLPIWTVIVTGSGEGQAMGQ